MKNPFWYDKNALNDHLLNCAKIIIISLLFVDNLKYKIVRKKEKLCLF